MAKQSKHFAVRIGNGFFAADDQPAVKKIEDAYHMPTRREALAEAETVRQTWDVEPTTVSVVPVLLVKS